MVRTTRRTALAAGAALAGGALAARGAPGAQQTARTTLTERVNEGDGG